MREEEPRLPSVYYGPNSDRGGSDRKISSLLPPRTSLAQLSGCIKPALFPISSIYKRHLLPAAPPSLSRSTKLISTSSSSRHIARGREGAEATSLRFAHHSPPLSPPSPLLCLAAADGSPPPYLESPARCQQGVHTCIQTLVYRQTPCTCTELNVLDLKVVQYAVNFFLQRSLSV